MRDERKPSELVNLLKKQSETIWSLTNDLTNAELDLLCQKEVSFQKNLLSELTELKMIVAELMDAVANTTSITGTTSTTGMSKRVKRLGCQFGLRKKVR